LCFSFEGGCPARNRMTTKRDYYEVLGVSREASNDEIRKAYRQAALKFHPDRNPGDKNAEDSFKEATEAFSVLSDENKRPTYDRFGHAGLEGSAGVDFSNIGIADILSQFQDMFSDFFGGFGGFGGTARSSRGADRGQHVQVDVVLSLKDVMAGAKREVEVNGVAPCDPCAGTGAAPGTKPQRCSACGGSGQVASQRGFIVFASTCPQCRGTGKTVASPCSACNGQGRVERHRKVIVNIPAGVDNGIQLRLSGQGMPGRPGSPAGDLYVQIHVNDDPRFEREGSDLLAHEAVSFSTAALGGKFEVKLPDDSSVQVEVDAGTQPGSMLTMRGRGLPRLDRSGARGDLHVVINVLVPKKLSRKAKKLIEELEQECSS
jgi:molecular chaperone DnaJ